MWKCVARYQCNKEVHQESCIERIAYQGRLKCDFISNEAADKAICVKSLRD